MRRWLPYLPNLVSSIRILLIVPITLTLVRHRPPDTLILFAVAAVSDGLDGLLARRFGWQSELGGMLDPIADKLLLASVFVVLAVLGEVPMWLTTAVLARDAIIVLGAVAYGLLIGPVAARPSTISKVCTFFQLAFICSVIGSALFPDMAVAMLPLGALVFVLVAVSGVDYVIVYGRQAAHEFRARTRSA